MIKVRSYLADAAPLAWLGSTSEEDIRMIVPLTMNRAG